MAEQSRLDRFIMDDDELDEMIEYGQIESRCEMCAHYFGDNACEAYKVIPNEIWNEDVYHDSIRSDQIGEFIYTKG